MLNFKLFILLLFVSLNTLANEGANVFVQGNEIYYQGSLSKEANAQLILLYKNNNEKIDVLVIKSKGGDVNTGLDLADFIFEKKLNVKVLDYCLSSCANYVFPAGKKKILSNNALVAFHGGVTGMEEAINEAVKSAPEEQREAMLQQFDSYQKAISARELKFYQKIRIDQSITSLGQAQKYQDMYGSDEDYIGWYYSIDSLNRLGVKDISVSNPPWALKQLSEKAKVFEVVVTGT